MVLDIVTGAALVAAGALADTGRRWLRSGTRRAGESVVLMKDAFYPPELSFEGPPSLAAKAKCSKAGKSSKQCYAVISGEVLHLGSQAGSMEAAVALGGAKVSTRGTSVSLTAWQPPALNLVFDTTREAQVWASKLTEISRRDVAPKRIDNLIKQLTTQEMDNEDLRGALDRTRTKQHKIGMKFTNSVKKLQEEVMQQSTKLKEAQEMVKSYKNRAKHLAQNGAQRPEEFTGTPLSQSESKSPVQPNEAEREVASPVLSPRDGVMHHIEPQVIQSFEHAEHGHPRMQEVPAEEDMEVAEERPMAAAPIQAHLGALVPQAAQPPVPPLAAVAVPDVQQSMPMAKEVLSLGGGVSPPPRPEVQSAAAERKTLRQEKLRVFLHEAEKMRSIAQVVRSPA